MSQAQDQPPSPQTLRRGYEDITVSNRGLVIFLICLLLGGAAIQGGLWVMVKGYAKWSTDADIPRSAVVRVDPFIDPRLQPTETHPEIPVQDLDSLHESDRKIFDSLGWKTDPTTGNPVIPDAVVAQLSARYGKTKGGGQP